MIANLRGLLPSLALGLLASLGTRPAHAEGATLGARGFAGLLVSEGEKTPVFGGGLLVGVPLYRRLELEGSVLWAAPREEEGFLVTEVVGKWVFESESAIAPHVTLGPLFSVDFKSPAQLSVGAVAGGGATWWFDPRMGLVTDLNYRLLVGQSVEQAVTWAGGCVFRL